MTNRTKYLLILLAGAAAITTGMTRSQGLDEDGAIVAEDVLIDEVVNGDILKADDVVVEDVAVEAVEAVAIEAVPVAAMEEVAVEAVVDEKGVPVVEDVEVEDVAVAVAAPAVADSDDLDELVAREFKDALQEGVEAPPADMTPAVVADVVVEEAIPAVAEEVVEEMPAATLDEAVEAIEAEPVAVVEAPVAVVEAPVAVMMVAEDAAEEPVPVAMPPVAVDPLQAELNKMKSREALRRQALEAHGLESLKEGQRALNAKNYKEAMRLFEDALRYIVDRPQTAEYRKEARKGLADCFYGWAVALVEQGDYEAAIEMARRSQAHGNPKADALLVKINEIKIGPEPKPEKIITQRWREKEYQDAEESVENLLRRARQHILVGEYERAAAVLGNVMVQDPENTEAIRLLHKVALKKLDRSTMELGATRDAMIASVRDTWNPRNYGQTALPGDPITGGLIGAEDPSSHRFVILNKMKKIIIPEIDFQSANIYDVVQFLQEASVDFDPDDTAVGSRGVNIILHIGGAGPAAPSAPAVLDPFADTLGGAGLGTSGDIHTISFQARYISLLEALKIVTKVANLKFRIEGSVVMIVPANAPVGDLVVRTYNVLPSVEEKIGTADTEMSAPRGNDDFHAMSGGGGLGLEGGDWKVFFGSMGVPWPDGSTIKYVRSIGKLVVGNTADNLTIFEQVLSELNVTPQQIEIESRFVEVAQTDLDALGFEWLLTDNWELAARKDQAGVLPGGQQRIMVPANTPGGFTTGLRYANVAGVAGATVADNVLSIASVLTNPEVSMILHMLQQKGNSDLLSAPKVTTKSGNEAMIKVVTEYIYPTEFTVTPVTESGTTTGGGARIVGGVVEPGGFETREVGVILSVLPEVSAEGHMINLTMTPEVVSEPEWYEYGSVFTDSAGNEQRLNMQQPFFHTRTISTSISIYNGATVVMGGMITEARNEVDDKVPFLGDIPIIGRLFRSRSEHSVKRNLLIFVTARLVDPAGNPIMSKQDGPTLTRATDSGGLDSAVE